MYWQGRRSKPRAGLARAGFIATRIPQRWSAPCLASEEPAEAEAKGTGAERRRPISPTIRLDKPLRCPQRLRSIARSRSVRPGARTGTLRRAALRETLF